MNEIKYSYYEYNPEKTDSWSSVFISEKELETESGLGKLVTLVKIDSKEKRVSELVEKIKEEFSHHFYLAAEDNPEKALEHCCQLFNESLLELINKPSRFLSKISLLVAVIKDKNIYLSFSNKSIGAWLLRKEKLFNILSSGQKTENTQETSKKILDNLISGKFETDDVLLLATNTIFDYFSQNKIKEVLTYSPDQATNFFRRIIENSIKKDSFAITIIKYQKSLELIKELVTLTSHQEDKLSNYSMEELVTLEKTTSNLLRSSIILNLQKILKTTNPIKWLLKKTKKTNVGVVKSKSQSATVNKLTNSLQFIFNKLSSKKQSQLKIRDETATKPIKLTLSLSNKIKRTLFSNKLLIIFTIILIFLFIISLFVMSYRQKKSLEQNKIIVMIEDIESNIESAQSAIIYQDKDKARQRILEAQALLNQYADFKKTDHQIINDLIGQINQVMIKAFNVVILQESEVFFDLTPYQFKEPYPGDLKSLIYAQNLYLTNNENVFQINLKNKSLIISNHNQEIFSGRLFDDNHIIYLTKQGQFLNFNTANQSFTQVDIDLSNEESAATFNIYSKRLYTLDEKKQQIYKHEYFDGRYGVGKEWLKEEIKLENSLDMAIDGDIYLITNNDITKLFSGNKQNFQVKEFDKSISGATKIYTNQQLDDLYVLDPPNNRLVLINKKTQRISKQFYSEKFNNLKDFAVTPTSNIYLLNAEQIYLIED